MHFLQAVTVFATCCFVHFTVTRSQLHANTQFTDTPARTIIVNLGSTVNLRWTLQFGDSTDHGNFEELYWGVTDNNEKIRNKYLTVFSNNGLSSNTANPASLRNRISRASGHISQKEITQTFILQSVTKSDAQKTYGCTADVWGEKIESGPITIRVRPSITITTNRIRAVNGQTVTLQCDATGVPTPYVSWSKGGVQLQNSTVTSYSIPSITSMKAGSYVCRATNPFGSVSHTIVVSI